MNDDLPQLRQGLADLAENAGNADLYDRSLRASRRLARRRAAAGVAAAIGLGAAVAVPVALLGRPGPAPVPLPPGATTVTSRPAPFSPSAPPPEPAPSSTAAEPTPSDAPETRIPSPRGPSARPPAPTAVVPVGGCPVRADTLWDAARGSGFDGPDNTGVTDVDCHRGWATAVTTVEGPADPVSILFAYDSGAGTWTAVDVGSSMECSQVPATVVTELKHCFPG